MSVTLTVDNQTGAVATLVLTPPGGAAATHVLQKSQTQLFTVARNTMLSASVGGTVILQPTPVTETQSLTLQMDSGDALPINYGCTQAKRVALAGAAATALLGVSAYLQQQHHKALLAGGMTPDKCRAEFGAAFCAKYEAGAKSSAPSMLDNVYGRVAMGMALATALYWAYTQSTFLSSDTCLSCQVKGGQWTGKSFMCTRLDLCDCHT